MRFAHQLRTPRDQLLQRRGPGLVRGAVATHAEAAHLQVGGEFQIRVAIADHRARIRDRLVRRAGTARSRSRLAALSTASKVTGRLKTHRSDALRAKVQHELVACVERHVREACAAEAVLVGDHHEAVTAALSFRERGKHPGHEPHLVETIDLLVGGSSISVPSRSTKSVGGAHSPGLEQPIILFRRADADPQRVRKPRVRARSRAPAGPRRARARAPPPRQ